MKSTTPRFKVLVHTVGRKDYEFACSFDTLEEAEERVEFFRKNRDQKVAEGKMHYDGLEWDIIDLERSK